MSAAEYRKACGGCDSTLRDRERYACHDPTIPLLISKCPHCAAEKCCMCDMGDDVECSNCHNADGGDLEPDN